MVQDFLDKSGKVGNWIKRSKGAHGKAAKRENDRKEAEKLFYQLNEEGKKSISTSSLQPTLTPSFFIFSLHPSPFLHLLHPHHLFPSPASQLPPWSHSITNDDSGWTRWQRGSTMSLTETPPSCSCKVSIFPLMAWVFSWCSAFLLSYKEFSSASLNKYVD